MALYNRALHTTNCNVDTCANIVAVETDYWLPTVFSRVGIIKDFIKSKYQNAAENVKFDCFQSQKR